MEIFFDQYAKNSGIPKPVATFAWKLLDITEISLSKQADFLQQIQRPVECLHKNLEKLKKKVSLTLPMKKTFAKTQIDAK